MRKQIEPDNEGLAGPLATVSPTPALASSTVKFTYTYVEVKSAAKLDLRRGAFLGLRPSTSTLASLVDQTAFVQPGFGPQAYAAYGSTDTSISPVASDPARPPKDDQHIKRKTPPNPSGTKSVKKVKRVGPRDSKADVMPNNADGEKDGDGSANKPKRVRTGCLTCRERHLKCDEALPHCNNCKKSNRKCKRGVRLNFIDTWAERPPKLMTKFGTDAWRVTFQDESRDIADEYQGGLERYKPLEQDAFVPSSGRTNHGLALNFSATAPHASASMAQPLPPIQGILPETYPEIPQQQQPHTVPADMGNVFDPQLKHDPNNYPLQAPNSGSTNDTHYSAAGSTAHGSVASYQTAQTDAQLADGEKKDFLNSADETLFMQVFVEEVGLWMDTLLTSATVSLAFRTNATECLFGLWRAHLTLVNSAYTEEKALHYYDTATRYLLKNLQNPNRDTVICATTAVILNVYEIMSERALQRMNHIAGARALIKECGWNARAQGIGAACFWLNVGLEVLSCLHFNWQVAWDPDEWGIDMDFRTELQNGREELWTHRMLYLVAKVCNFRATIPRQPEPNPRDQETRTQQRYEEWARLKGMIDAWNEGVPRTMHPMAFVYPQHSGSKSCFPEVWLVKRTTIVARLFYHTAYLLMAQIHPYYGSENYEMADLQRRHSQIICGIAAHVKDRGVASVCIRSLAHASEVLTDRREQEEVLQIFEKINKETGWRIGFVYKELKEKWGWNEHPSPEQYAQTHTAVQQQRQAAEAQQRQLEEQARVAQSMQLQQGFPTVQDYNHLQHQQNQHMPQQLSQMAIAPPQPLHPTPPQQAPQPQQQTPAANKRPPAGIPNPMYKQADFTLPQHPYQNFYVAPANGYTGNQQTGGVFYSFQ
ncbi:Fungal specific transcription factor domain [Teratosphaeria destructans]|uniref:Fungal specific transcription factor domain n=1 Tax=Teratosphaeria destructans TaxID=418781 RepID=A0A9W7W4B2_9PEZI|nr:Fungal specific transcription factor domain [Teratosphaeria destructans]